MKYVISPNLSKPAAFETALRVCERLRNDSVQLCMENALADAFSGTPGITFLPVPISQSQSAATAQSCNAQTAFSGTPAHPVPRPSGLSASIPAHSVSSPHSRRMSSICSRVSKPASLPSASA